MIRGGDCAPLEDRVYFRALRDLVVECAMVAGWTPRLACQRKRRGRQPRGFGDGHGTHIEPSMGLPEAFYKYLSPLGALAVLESGRLRWSSPLLFDDPAEFRRLPRFTPTLDESATQVLSMLVDHAYGESVVDEPALTATARTHLDLLRMLAADGMDREDLRSEVAFPTEGADAQLEAALKSFVDGLTLQTTRILCVSTAANSERLWDQYAEGGRGVVLELRHVPELSTPLLAARPVAYATELPVVGSGVEFLLYGASVDLRRRMFDAIVNTKKSDWSYQDEWRVVTWVKDEGDREFADYKFCPAELSAVVLGPHAEPEFSASVRSFVRYRYPECELR